MADWYGSREQLMSLHGLDTAMLGYGMGVGAAAAFPPIQPEAYTHAHAHAAAAAAYNFQRQQQSVSTGFTHSCFGPEQQWRHNADGSIMELRKEKSRDAARSRRGKENYEFYELAKMLPLPQAITSQLDKASIIRLTISYLKLRDFTIHGDPPWHRDMNHSKSLKSGALRHRTSANMAVDLFEQHQGTHILQSLDGFAFALAADGRFLYISETVSIYLGLSQVEMTGSSVFDYIHTEDHQELADHLGLTLATGQPLPSPSSLGSEDTPVNSQGTMNPDVASCMSISSTTTYKGYERAFCIRMKSTLTKRGCHFKSSGYRVVLVLGHLRPQCLFSHSRKTAPQIMGLVALAIALPPPSVHEVRLEPDMFVTRINFDFRIAHCEPKASELLDFTPEELQGRSLYNLCHGQDVDKLKRAHSDLMKKGQVMSPYFRILNKRGGYTWMQICATIICNSKSGEEQNIICVNYILSNCQCENLILDDTQLDPTLINMKTDKIEYTSATTPDSSGDISRVRGEDSAGGCCSPVAASVPGAAQSPQAAACPPEVVNAHLENSPATPGDGAQIKTEVPGGLLTPMGSTDVPDESRMHHERASTSPGGRVSAPPASTPSSILPRTTSASSSSVTNLNTHGPLETSPVPMRTDEGSVRDLEAAMTRHLPEDAHDFSTDALLRASSGTSTGPGSHRTIQWVGGTSTPQSSLPASTLLRQLYANRESVIRKSVPGTYYPDVQSALPTPPGHDGYQESMFVKNHDFTYNNGGPGSSAAAGIGMPGNGTSYPDYHSAMTPPSSVSPREKMAGSECAEMRGPQPNYLGDSASSMPAQPLPLKPQVYSYGPGVSLDAPSYSSPLTEQTSSLYSHPGFHLYHTQGKSPGAYDSLRTGTSWYSPSS